MRIWVAIISCLLALGCTKADETAPTDTCSLTADFSRVDQVGFAPVSVRAYLKVNGSPSPGKTLAVSAPLGSLSAVTDNGDGSYSFTLTPSTSGSFPITVAYGGASFTRKAIVTHTLATGSGLGQPLEVPGDMINTDGYEDGITITPDGNYLFMQYGPLYFSGIANVSAICSSGSYSLYDVLTCGGRTDSSLVFNTIGPYNTASRPNFPSGNITAQGKLTPLNITVPGVANGVAVFPTVFYGFKKQSDGTFAEPFKVAFNDVRGLQGPYGLSFVMTSANTANFAFAWHNQLNDIGGDGKPDIYTGSLTLGQDKNLGDVVYSGETYASITPYVTPVSFTSHAGVQGNPHLYADGTGAVKSIWTDDEQTTHALSVYVLASGTYPSGTWTKVTLPSTINTAGEQSQPFFTGTRLYLTRDTKIVYHDYNGGSFSSNASWGPEHVLLSSGDTTAGSIFGFGEPTLATVGGKTYLYFAFVRTRAILPSTRADFNIDAGFVELQ